jgi:hypothetical protein
MNSCLLLKAKYLRIQLFILSYDGLVLNGYKHYQIHHYENEFARGKNHVNGIESFWSCTKDY